MKGVVVSLPSPTSHTRAIALTLTLTWLAPLAAQSPPSPFPIPTRGGWEPTIVERPGDDQFAGSGEALPGGSGTFGIHPGQPSVGGLSSPGYLAPAPPEVGPSQIFSSPVAAVRQASNGMQLAEILYPGDDAAVRVQGGVTAATLAQVFRFTRADGQTVDVPAARWGADRDGWIEGRFDPKQLIGEGPTTFVARTTDAGDAPLFRDGVARTLPGMQVAYDDAREEGASGSAFGGIAITEAGGIHRVPFQVLDDRGGSVASGAVAIAAKASWMYFSGHYPAGSGLEYRWERIHPSSIQGAGWRDHLSVLIFASCYAGEVAGQPLAGDRLSGRGLDGAAWWERFRGTVLGYRGSAPTEAAPAVNREFLARVAALRVKPSDKHRYSQAIAGAWMRANGKVVATNATAIDSKGNYYFMGSLEAPLPGAKVIAKVPLPRGEGKVSIRAVPEASWRPPLEHLQAQTGQETPLVRALQDFTYGYRGSKPFDGVDEFLAAPQVARFLQDTGHDPASPEVRRVLARQLRYDAHLFYESDAGMGMLVSRMAWLVEQEGVTALTRERILRELTPSPAAHALGDGGRLRPWKPSAEELDQILLMAEEQARLDGRIVQ